MQVCVAYGLVEGSASTSALAALGAVAAIVVVLLFPRQALLVALAAVPLADVELGGMPVGEILVAGAALGLVVRFLAGDSSLEHKHPPAWLVVGFGLMLYLLFASSVYNGALEGDAFRRFGHLAVGGVLAWLLAARVVEPGQAAKALLVGLLASGLFGLAGATVGVRLIAMDDYGSRLTGWFGDPNVAGFYLVTLGVAALAFLSSMRARVSIGAVLLVLVYATLSRTSLLAVVVVVAWVVASHRGYNWLPIVVLLACGLLALNVAGNLKESGPFRDRGESDWFRQDVNRKTEDRAKASPLLGEGAAPERIAVQGGRIFPHDSYLAAVVEGGIFWLLAWLALLGGTLWKLMRAKRRNLLLEGALVAVFVIALNLGEVFFELPTMILVGLALAYLGTETSREPQLSRSVTQPPGASPPAPAWGSPAPT